VVTRERAWRLAAIAAALTVLADQATKQLVVASLARGETRNVFFGIDLTNTRNNGVAFGALAGGGALITILTLGALALLVTYFAMRASTPWLWLPTGVILGGALGNLADRARDGAVIDFIDPAFWPAFNLADAAVVIGILGLLYVIEKPAGEKS
jgi:signal peptidase II